MSNKALDILLDDERTALQLSMVHIKSTWEAGEIMNKAHYKYLEIKARAEAFVKLFTAYYEKYDELLPVGDFLHRDFKEYLICVIIQRKTQKETSDINPKSLLYVDQSRDRLIISEVEKLKKSEEPQHIDLLHLISEFDRWNNFRILPKDIQEPSAFKRRNKTRNLKHIKKIASIPKFSIKAIINRYQYDGKYNKLFVPLITDISSDGYMVIPIKETNTNIEEVSKIGLFIFKTHEEADNLGHIIDQYISKNNKTCKEGQRFWPNYRTITTEAINWKVINNIIPKRKYLQNAFKELNLLDKPKIEKKKSKVKSAGAKRL